MLEIDVLTALSSSKASTLTHICPRLRRRAERLFKIRSRPQSWGLAQDKEQTTTREDKGLANAYAGGVYRFLALAAPSLTTTFPSCPPSDPVQSLARLGSCPCSLCPSRHRKNRFHRRCCFACDAHVPGVCHHLVGKGQERHMSSRVQKSWVLIRCVTVCWPTQMIPYTRCPASSRLPLSSRQSDLVKDFLVRGYSD